MYKNRLHLTFGILAIFTGGCGSDDTSQQAKCDAEPGASLCPPAPDEGLQLRIQGSVEGGAERTLCSFFEVPEGGIDVARFQHVMSGGSHHLLIYPTNIGPSAAAQYAPVFDCVAPRDFGIQLSGVLFGT